MSVNRTGHIRITSHPGAALASRFPITWGAPSAAERGPVVAGSNAGTDRNAIGAHGGAYSVYRALAIASGQLKASHRADLTNTAPAEPIGPFPQWAGAERIVSLDPYGHVVSEVFADLIASGYDIRPTIAVTKAHINMPELRDAMEAGRLKADGGE